MTDTDTDVAAVPDTDAGSAAMPDTDMVRLPDGQVFAVSLAAAGVRFRRHGHDGCPLGWTVVVRAAADADADAGEVDSRDVDAGDAEERVPDAGPADGERAPAAPRRPWPRPSLGSDALFVAAADPPRHPVAPMLWISLYWYFHLPAPAPSTAPGAPGAPWRVRLRPAGALAGPAVLAGLERTGLVACEDAAAAAVFFASQPAFWQLPARPFLPPLPPPSPPPGLAPAGPDPAAACYPPPTLLAVSSPHGVRHPLRPRPPPPGHVFYARFVPSVGQYLAFRVASSSPRPVAYRGPVGPDPARHPLERRARLAAMSDAALLESWHASPRVAEFWGPYQPDALAGALAAPHSFPVIGLWDGVPFGYFEIYWAKEDLLGRHVNVADWDRGVHLMVGEEWARGRVASWLTSLVHWALAADPRTLAVCLEPRVDNPRCASPPPPPSSRDAMPDHQAAGSCATSTPWASSGRGRSRCRTSRPGTSGCRASCGGARRCELAQGIGLEHIQPCRSSPAAPAGGHVEDIPSKRRSKGMFQMKAPARATPVKTLL